MQVPKTCDSWSASMRSGLGAVDIEPHLEIDRVVIDEEEVHRLLFLGSKRL